MKRSTSTTGRPQQTTRDMFSTRLLAPLITRSAICFVIILSGPTHRHTAVAQELSPTLLRVVPRVAERLQSADINERISVLDELVTVKRDGHLPGLLFPYNLPASDYSFVVQNILAGNLEEVDEKRASTTWWKLNHVAAVFMLKELVKPLTGYLAKTGPPIQLDILKTLRRLNALESVSQIVTLLQSPQEHIRREALATLVSLRAKEAIAPLVALLQDKNELTRYYALISLVTVNGREATPAIAKSLDDESENNRYWALDALVKLNAREHAQAVWKLTDADQRPQTQAYAMAALIYFGEKRAISLAVKRATERNLARRTDMLNFLVTLKAEAIAPALVAVLESRTVLGDDPSDLGTDSNIRRDIMTCLGKLGARDAIPVLRSYARGRDSNMFLQRAAVTTLGLLGAGEGVDYLLPLLDQVATGDEYVTAEAGVALAEIGDRKTWRKLIDLAARPACPYRSEIISELNRHLDSELWERIQTQKVHGLAVKSVKTTVEAFDSESGIRIVLEYQPGRESPGRSSLDGDGYPWANTSGEEISLSYGLRQIIEGLSNDRTPRYFTFIFDHKQIRILSVERAIDWWRKQILSRSSF